jgi:hypothetical protein
MVFSIKRKRQHHDDLPNGAQAPDNGKRKKILLIFFLVILIISNLFLFIRLMKSRTTIIYQQQVLMNVQEPPDASSEISGTWYGLCEKNSIHSIQDFMNIVENDDLLAKHFSDFDWKNARMGALESAVWAHLAYRKNERISTTRKVIRLPKGDGYITDGKRWLRTYCCNDYVVAGPTEAAAAPTTASGPAPDPDTDLDQAVKKVGPLPDVNSRAAGPDRLNKKDETIIAVVPEPTPLLLLGTGIALLALMTWRQRRLHGKT